MKKLLGIMVLGLLVSLVTSQAISKDKLPGCEISKKPEEKIIEAPEAVLKKHKTLSNISSDIHTTTITKYRAIAKNKKDNLIVIKSQISYYASWAKEDVIKSCKLFFAPYGKEMQNACYVDKVIEKKEKITISKNRIKKVLASRRTINVFRAWLYAKKTSANKYGLNWSQVPIVPGPSNLSLMAINWNYHKPERASGYLPGLKRFITKKNWKARGHTTGGEYGKTVFINYSHPEFADYFSDLVLEKAHGFDGVMLDWWHNEHPGASKTKVKKARRKIAEAIRNKMGKEFIILGNVNWHGDGDTHDLINGVFMELSKTKKTKSAYSCNEITKIEKLIKFHDQNLSEPKIIAVNTWRITKKTIGKRYRSSPENIQFAKLFTAMAMVIPENGYILYGDNNNDYADSEHDHTYYDFYNTDLGNAISDEVEITEGLAYKKYEKGLIAYNRTKFKYTVKFKDGKKVEIGPLEGVFVKD